jgi:hypothetical protein
VNRKQLVACDFVACRDRNRIERMFNRIKQFRRIASRYKTAPSFLSFLNIAAAKNLAAILCQGQSNPAAISTNPKMTRVCPMPAPSLRFSGRFGLERRRPIRRTSDSACSIACKQPRGPND